MNHLEKMNVGTTDTDLITISLEYIAWQTYALTLDQAEELIQRLEAQVASVRARGKTPTNASRTLKRT